jgi:hypothetical protein
VKGLVDTSRPSLIEGLCHRLFFLASLDAAAAVVHSCHSAEGELGSAHRHRLILTCQWRKNALDWPMARFRFIEVDFGVRSAYFV